MFASPLSAFFVCCDGERNESGTNYADTRVFTVHCSLSAVTHAPFHASVLRPASQAGPMHEATGMGKLINAALLSLINEACVSMLCYPPPESTRQSRLCAGAIE